MQFRMILFLSALLFSTSSFAAVESASVTLMQGDVQVFRKGEWKPVTSQTTLQEGDLIKTGKGAQVDISMQERAGVRLLSGTETSIKKLMSNQALLELKIGNIIANLEKYGEGSKFEVETPIAILGVRGTQFWGRVEDPRVPIGTTFAVREGTVNVRVKESNEAFILEEGEALDIPWDESKEPVEREAYEDEMEALEQAEEIEIEEDETEDEKESPEQPEEIDTEEEVKAADSQLEPLDRTSRRKAVHRKAG